MAQFVGQGPVGLPGGTSVVFTSPFPLAKGTRAVGTDGSVYILCDITGTVYSGLPVAIMSDNTAGPLALTHRGRIGVVTSEATSDNYAWVQVYGATDMQIGVAGTSPSDAANGPTTVQTSLAIQWRLATSATTLNVLAMVSDSSSVDDRYVIRGIQVTVDPSIASGLSAVTSATSHTGNQVGVFLNFPEVFYNAFNITS
jgi:hypothetical protein